MTDAGTTQDNFILPAPPVGGLPISQDWLDRMKLVHDRTVPIILNLKKKKNKKNKNKKKKKKNNNNNNNVEETTVATGNTQHAFCFWLGFLFLFWFVCC